MTDAACRNDLFLFVPDDRPPRIIVPPHTREPLIRYTHEMMFHLGHAKVSERLSRSYFWPTLRGDTRKILGIGSQKVKNNELLQAWAEDVLALAAQLQQQAPQKPTGGIKSMTQIE